MSFLIADTIYLGFKSCFYISKYIGIAGYNLIAYPVGGDLIPFFPPSENQKLIEEIRDLKTELIEIKNNMKYKPNYNENLEYILIEEIDNHNDPKLITFN
jgi:hypothetical protein